MRKGCAMLLAALAATPSLARAQDALVDPVDSGSTAWILTSAALVLLMTLPGLGLLYGGLVRARNFLSVLIQCGAIAAIASLLWIVVGYTLAFGDVTSGWLGAGNAWMLIELGQTRAGTNLPESAFALFHMMFAAFAPALMAGAWVGRARFGWVIGFCALWGLVVFAPAVHWIWGGGWLASSFGTLDFGGGIVVYTTAGVSALVAAVLLGRREGFPLTVMPPHSPALTMAGAMMLWIGWLGFNGGSALAADDGAASAIIATHAAASAAALAWLVIERVSVGKPTGVGLATGAIAGLATVTPAAGYISPGAAIVFGIIAASLCYPMIQLVKQRWLIDDSLDVFAIHGIGGITGSLLLGIFISPSLGGVGYAEGMAMGSQMVAQILGVGAVALWAAIASAILALMVSIVLPMRIGVDAEREGLDIDSHGERAWDFD